MVTAYRQIIDEGRFAPLALCWVCGGSEFAQVHQGLFDFTEYTEQDPELALYTGARFWLNRCRECGFAQPDALPTLANYFDRMYDQRWAEEWIEQEFESEAKDYIFKIVLGGLQRRARSDRRRLLDVGAHVGRLIYLAERSGWQSEGIELNPRTSAFAARKTGLPVHRVNAHSLAQRLKRYDAVTLLDVLEHIPDPV
ncbi:MAG TPA: methyltransferase domain-containing protein, partial [Blastocatellia bacterium]|nr:methyltransferase domain-containing protein [Blastocatellia bacterium]